MLSFQFETRNSKWNRIPSAMNSPTHEIFRPYKRMMTKAALSKALFAAFIFLVLAADWAALHDIAKGESDIWRECLFVLASALLFMTLSLHGLRTLRKG
jgi:hypothetical protein